MINIPSQTTKKWLTSFRGDFFGNLINMLNLDLFSAQGKARVGTKMYPHTTEADITGLTPPSDFETAQLFDGADRPTKVWAVSDEKIISREADGDTFEQDASTGFASDETTGSGSDLITVADNTDEPITVTEASVGQGGGIFQIIGSGNQTKWAQSFTQVDGPFYQLSLYLRNHGTPSDTLTVGIYTDNAGAPNTLLTSIDIDPDIDLTDTFTLYNYLAEDFSDPTVQFSLLETYWIVFSRNTPSTSAWVEGMMVIGGPTDDDPPNDPYEDGTLISYNGSAWSPSNPNHKRVFTYQGNDTFTAPAGVTSITVEAWGAGGGGSTNVGGGGGGEYARKVVTVVPGNVYNIVVGTSAVNADGGDSKFNATDVVAHGGKSGTNGGAGGTAGTGDVTHNGGAGAIGTGDKAGGGGAGDTTNGSTTTDASQGFGGSTNGGIGGGNFNSEEYDTGRIFAGGGNSRAATQFKGGRGAVRITFEVTPPTDFAYVADRSWGRVTGGGTQAIVVPATTLPGDLLMLVISADGATNISLSGWTVLAEKSYTTKVTQTILWKRATGDDNGDLINSADKGMTYVCYRIINGATPQASQTADTGTNPTSPTISGLENGNYLHFNTGSWNFATAVDINGSSPGFPFIQPPAFDNVDNRESLTAVSQTTFTGNTASGTWSSTSAEYVVGTVVIPFDDSRNFQDASFQLQVQFETATARLYLSTTKDVRVLAQEDGIWQSLWRGVYGQEPLDENYPHPMILLEAGGVMFVGDGNLLHSMIANGNNPTDATPSRLIFPASNFISWIILTKSAVFIGLQNKISEDLPSYVCYYEPFTEVTRIFNIEEGATVGWEQNENCYILDKAGQLRYYNGSDFVVMDTFPPYYYEQVMNLPHRNGIVDKNSITHFLWKGGYPYPAGIWTYDENRLYHRFGFVFDKENLNSFGAVDVPTDIEWRALYPSIQGLLASGAVTDGGGDPVQGIFSNFKNDTITVADNNRSHFQTIKFQSPGIDNVWQRVFAKIDQRTDGIVEGEVILKQRYQNSPFGEGYNAPPAFAGTWTDSITFESSDTTFVALVTAGSIVVGDEIIVRAGLGAGMLAHITAITGTTTKTVTINNGLAAITTGDFTFSVENWRIIANRGVTGKSSEWLQVKAEVRDFVEVVELQVGSKINRSNEE